MPSTEKSKQKLAAAVVEAIEQPKPKQYRLQVPLYGWQDLTLEDLVSLLQESGEVSLSVTWEVTSEFTEFDIADTVQEINARANLSLGHPEEVRS